MIRATWGYETLQLKVEAFTCLIYGTRVRADIGFIQAAGNVNLLIMVSLILKGFIYL